MENEYTATQDSMRIESILEGVVQMLQMLDGMKQQLNQMEGRLTALERQQQMNTRAVSDTMLMSNNLINEVEDIHSELNSLSDKIDTLDYDVKNIKVFKYISEV